MNQTTSNPEIVYHLRLADPASHIVAVSCRIDVPDAGGQVFSLPVWIPGSYMIRDYARHVLSVTASSSAGEVAIRKVDKATWTTEATDGPLVLHAEIYAGDLSVRGAFLDSAHAFINGVCVFFRIHGMEAVPCVVHIDPPPGMPEEAWQLATALPRLSGQARGFGAFRAADYDTLVDSPVLMGPLTTREFEVDGIPHEIVLVGRQQADLDRVAADLTRVCSWHAGLFGGRPPLSRYRFLTTVLAQGYGGLEHRDSSALICSRNSLPRHGDDGIAPEYRKFLGLASHEYFHLWNVKRIRPAGLTPYRFDRENYTRQLWLFEGITAYYDDLALRRCGLIDVASYLELLGRSLTSVYRNGGRRRQTLEESSFDAWIKFYRQEENAPNAIVSYYTKGAMVMLALDLELRLRSAGEVSLDDVMRVLWQEYGTSGRGVPDGAFEQIVSELAGEDMQEFFRQGLRSTIDPPVGILLAQFGVRLNLRPSEGSDDAGGLPGKRGQRSRPWLGLRTRTEGDRLMVAHVLADGPGCQAGVSAGDELVAIDGLRVAPAIFDSLHDELPLDRDVSLHVFRRAELIQMRIRPVRPPRDTAWLVVDAEADSESQARRRGWLGA